MGDTPRSERCFLPKKERLRRKRAFEYLFEHGDSFGVGVLTFFYALNVPEDWVEAPVSVAFSAPKRKFKRAVDRNFLKRRMREAYRLNKHALVSEALRLDKNLILLISFRARQLTDYQQIERAVVRGMELLQKRIISSSDAAAPTDPTG